MKAITLVMAGTLWLATPIWGATIVVNSAADDSTPDDGLTTLREAITAANNDPAADTITFSLNYPAWISLNGPLPDLSTDMTIEGPAANLLTVTPWGECRIFNVVAGNVTLSGMTIAYGGVSGQFEGGGGIRVGNGATVTVESCEVTSNYAEWGGGGIFVDAGGTANVNSSSIVGNAAGEFGGGLFARSTGVLNVNNSTAVENYSVYGAGIAFDGSGNINNSTIAWNWGESGAFGVQVQNGPVTIHNTVLYNEQDLAGDNGSFDISDHNFISNTDGDPNLAYLDYHGGPTRTMLPLPGSPLIDAGNPGFVPSTSFDQRGSPFFRVFAGIVDIGAVEAEPLIVSNTGDVSDGNFAHGQLTLREAIELANLTTVGPFADSITFHPTVFSTPQTINLTGALPSLSDLEIHGPGANLLIVRRDTGGNYPVFNCSNNILLEGMTIAEGAGNSGGNVSNAGELTVRSCAITGSVNGTGAVFNDSSGTLSLTDSTLSGNSSTAVYNAGTATLTNCTVQGNNSAAAAGGIFNDMGTLTIRNSTIVQNQATGGSGGGVGSNGGTVSIGSSIVALNSAAFDPDVSGAYTGAFNFIGGDPMLGPLTDNGGPTQTMALLPHSPCINTGDPAFASPPDTDQRGQPRVSGWFVDIGAYEFQGPFNESLVVTVTADEDNGTSDASYGNGTSLREAIRYANVHAGPDEITFDLGSGAHIINLSGALPNLASDMSITGPGASLLTVRRDTGGEYRIFSLPEVGPEITLSGMTISNGLQSGSGYGGGIHSYGSPLTIDGCIISGNFAGNQGGGIFSQSKLVVRNSTFSGNHGFDGAAINGDFYGTQTTITNCIFSGNDGWAIFCAGTLTLADSTISGNTRGGLIFAGTGAIDNCTFSGNTISENYRGGAAIDVWGGSITVTNSTFSNNSVTAEIGNGGAITAGHSSNDISSNLMIRNCTFTGNSAPHGGAIHSVFTTSIRNCTISGNTATVAGGGIVKYEQPVTIANNIVALNSAPTGPNLYSASGTLTDAGFNFIGGDPKLAPLADNGGPTLTMALLPGSPCIDAGDPNFAPPPGFDQRGTPFARVFGGRLDIGAFEYQAIPVPPDFDHDGDVDSDDLAHLKSCRLGPKVAQNNPLCADARLDGDDDVDGDDFAVWQRCHSGANQPANPACSP